jgi:hypothetical protein
VEFLPDSIRRDPALQGPNNDLPFFSIFAKFEMSLQEIIQNLDGLNHIISKLPKGEKQSDTDRLTLSVVKAMKEQFLIASLNMRKELGSHVE